IPEREVAGTGPDPRPAAPASGSSAGADLDPRTLRDAVLTRLAKSHVVLASALDKSLTWTLTDNRLEILFRSGYEEAMARRDMAVLVKAAGDAAGRALKVEFRVEEAPRNPPPAARDPSDSGLPEETPAPADSDAVEIVERVFRGKRVESSSGSPRSGETDGYF
ncbi:MAG: hypothetical protein GX430_02190, partial [Treponema sp.]|nr:hypothetical protein [Treponema sp.]